MTDDSLNLEQASRPPPGGMREALKKAVDIALPQTPAQFARKLFIDKWGSHIDPYTAHMVTLDYNYKGHPAQEGVQQGQVASSQTLIQALLSNYQVVGDGRFGETGFGLYTPAEIGPSVRIVEHVDEFANHGSGNHETFEGIYRLTEPQRYGPLTQIRLRPEAFKQWVWTLELKDLYQAYLGTAWPADAAVLASRAYPLRTSVKAAFVMSAWLQRHEGSVSQQGLELALQATGLPARQAWSALTLKQLQAPTRVPASVKFGRLKLYRYTATDIWTFRLNSGSRVLLYIPGNSSPIHEFADEAQLRRWVVTQGAADETRQALVSHFVETDRTDGTFHAGVVTALEGMAVFPEKHWLSKTAGLFNDDGYWNPADYIGFEETDQGIDPFAQLVLSMKRAAQSSVYDIRDDAQVNRDNLKAFVEPMVQWINQFGPLAMFVPGGEGLLALAGIIDAGYGLDETISSETSTERSQGLTRTVFGLLNALPLAAEGGLRIAEEAKVPVPPKETPEPGEILPEQDIAAPQIPAVVEPATALPATASRLQLLRGIGPSVASFSDETLTAIGRVSTIGDDMLRLMHMGREPTPLLADTISRFRIDQALDSLASDASRSTVFNERYQALQHSDNAWVGLFQRQYPDLPKSAVEQMLDRYGVDLQSTPDGGQARQLFSRLDGKARQYQQHVRLNRAYEGLYLRSIANPESDILALHSLKNLPGWPKGLRVEVREGSIGGRLVDRSGPLDTSDVRSVIKSGVRYQDNTRSTQDAFTADLYEAVAGVLSSDERSALGLIPGDRGTQLKLKVSDRPLPRSELVQGLGRMDAGLPFEEQGLRGGGYPDTPQGEALVHEVMRSQLKEIYPEFSSNDADEALQRLGADAQRHIDHLRQQLQQLYTDIDSWIDQVALDINDMNVPFVQMGNPQAAGLNHAQLAVLNANLLQEAMRYEAQIRTELAEELIDIWRKRAPQEHSRYSGSHVEGFVMDMSHENYHRLPLLNVRFNDVVGLNLENFHATELQTLNGFLERFPNLRTLNLQDTDLRLPNINGQLEGLLPTSIAQLQHLVTLNLRATQLTFRENTAAQLSSLINLQTLDLSENPLGIPPVVLGMNQLRSLNLRDAGITTCPIGIMEQPYLTTLDLRNNLIRRVPPAVMNQAIARDRVLLWDNPLDDTDTLQRLVLHRQRTGINLWLSEPGNDYSDPANWLYGVGEGPRNFRLQIWQRLALRPGGGRFLGTMNTLTLTPDFQVNYLDLQARVWRLLTDANASQELWSRLTRNVPLPAGAFDNPLAVFTALEDRVRLYANWVALGRPFPVPWDAP